MRKFFSIFIVPILICILLCTTTGCRDDELVVAAEYEEIPEATMADSPLAGMYLLNEGNMGSNKCTLDYLEFSTGFYIRNIYAEHNPNVVKELGDVGNDIAIYGNRLYIVVNCSHKVEVLDAHSGVRIGQVDIPNCRYLAFHDGYLYVSSFVGPVQVNSDSPKGAVYKVDAESLSIVDKVVVGYQPEQMAIVGDKMYVANSGGYIPPEYDTTLSEIDLATMRQTAQIEVGKNPGNVLADRYGNLWVSVRGDNENSEGRGVRILLPDEKGRYSSSRSEFIAAGCNRMILKGDSLLTISSASNYGGKSGYKVIDVKSRRLLSDNFIHDGTEQSIRVPYGLSVNPTSGDILISDAGNYVSSGVLHCYTSAGRLRWSVRTGDIPSGMVFLNK